MTAVAPQFPRVARVTGVVWFAAVTVAAVSGFLSQLPFPGAQLIILGLTALAITASLTVLKPWLDAVPLRWLIGINAARLIGIVFLVLAARGQLSPVFAARAGWGDITVAVLAILLVLGSAPRSVVHAWNVLGFLDLIVAVATATIVGAGPLLSFPLSLVPTFAVPLFLANHITIFRRLRA